MPELPPLTLYSRQGCHLCEDAENALKSLGWAFTRCDVDADPLLKATYGFDVPVLAVAGRVVLKGVITRSRLLRWRAGVS
ncbi:glutaredoxin family protein [Deinococcus sp. KNUC1210]|uniref:glutaredoxin family protein n=1 Tax=Deinococcus sp. KNUC1210 TaxID=2917691 RepID=UPI001EEF91BE|nr:glutaredoxin family protein [Deinococcus sp. KNUC1210]ULH15598.1 glutaredoxin family protein [Deinococcus sp. KNUC1210]